MGSATEGLEKQVDDANREIAQLNERIGFLEQEMIATKEFMKEALVQGKCPLGQSSSQGRLVQTADAIGSGGGTGREEGGFKRLSESEYNYKMKMSVCVRCDKEYSKNPKYKNKHLRPLVVKEEDEIYDQEETEKEEEQEIVTGGGHQFKFLGKIGSREVIVLFGTAATHNFISRKLVTELQIPLERTRGFRVNFGFGPEAEGAEVCNKIVLKTQGIEIVERFFPTDLGIADVVLGNEWLSSIGNATLQGIPMTLTFEWHGRTVTLQADPSLSRRNEIGLMMLEWI